MVCCFSNSLVNCFFYLMIINEQKNNKHGSNSKTFFIVDAEQLQLRLEDPNRRMAVVYRQRRQSYEQVFR